MPVSKVWFCINHHQA